jgi:hypothetical protein
LILLTQGPTHEILVTIAQLLVVVEKLNFFVSAILKFFTPQKNCFASNLFKFVKVYGIPRMGRNFDDYPDFQKNHGGYKIMRHTVLKVKLFLFIFGRIEDNKKTSRN